MKRSIFILTTTVTIAVLCAVLMTGCYSYADEDYSVPKEQRTLMESAAPYASESEDSNQYNTDLSFTDYCRQKMEAAFGTIYSLGDEINYYFQTGDTTDDVKYAYTFKVSAFNKINTPSEEILTAAESRQNVPQNAQWYVLEMDIEANDECNADFPLLCVELMWFENGILSQSSKEPAYFLPAPETDNLHDEAMYPLKTGEKEHFVFWYALPEEASESTIYMCFNPVGLGRNILEDSLTVEQQDQWKSVLVQEGMESENKLSFTESSSAEETSSQNYFLNEIQKLGIKVKEQGENLNICTENGEIYDFDVMVKSYEILDTFPDFESLYESFAYNNTSTVRADFDGELQQSSKCLLRVNLMLKTSGKDQVFLSDRIRFSSDYIPDRKSTIELYGQSPVNPEAYETTEDGGFINPFYLELKADSEYNFVYYFLIDEECLTKTGCLFVEDTSIGQTMSEIQRAIQYENVGVSRFGYLKLWESGEQSNAEN